MAGKAPARAAAVHLILGEDSYLADRELEDVLQQAVGADRAEAVTVLYGDESRWEAVVSAASTGSLFASRRAVVVRRADLLRSDAARSDEEEAEKPARAKSKQGQDPVLRLLEAPPTDLTLVLLASKPDRRRNPWKRLCTEGVVHSAEPKKGRALREQVERELARRKLRLTPDAVSDLIDEVGQDLRRLVGEIDKLQAWGADRKTPLDAEDVHAVLGRGLLRPLYLLADAASGRDLPTSLERLEDLLQGGEEGLRILATLHRALRQVRSAAAMREARVPRSEIGARLLPPHMQFKLDALIEASRRWSERDLARAFRALERADRRIKHGADAATCLTATLVEACRAPAATAPSGPLRPTSWRGALRSTSSGGGR